MDREEKILRTEKAIKNMETNKPSHEVRILESHVESLIDKWGNGQSSYDRYTIILFRKRIKELENLTDNF